MEKKLVLIVEYNIHHDMLSRAVEALKSLMDLIKIEEGCMGFDLLEDLSNSNNIVIYETWENETLWQNHLSSEHMVTFKMTSRTFFKNVHVTKLNHL